MEDITKLLNVHNDDGEDWYRDDSLKDRYGSMCEKSDGDAGGSASFLPKAIQSGNKTYGLYCLAGGSYLIILGMYLFVNEALIRLGNLWLVGGILLFTGPSKTIECCMAPEKRRDTGCALTGLFLVFVGWPMSGIVLEMFGLLKSVGDKNSAAMLITSVSLGLMYIFCMY